MEQYTNDDFEELREFITWCVDTCDCYPDEIKIALKAYATNCSDSELYAITKNLAEEANEDEWISLIESWAATGKKLPIIANQ